MIPILYEANETAFITNGICRLRDILSAVVVEERNGIYELDFEYPVGGANFEQIQCGRIIAVRHDDTDDIQPFDIVGYSKPINGVVTFHAVHISYRLRGYVVEADNVNSLSTALTKLATATPANNFTYEADFTANGYAGAFNGVPRTVRQLLGGVDGSILDTYGGEYEWDKFRVILHKNRGVTADFKIRYGLNMVDYNEEVDYMETYTSAVPYWTGTDENSDEVLVTGNKVDSGYVPYNGFDKCVPLDLSDKFETEPTSAELEALALSKMTSQKVSTPQQSIEVDFVRLDEFEEFESVAPLLRCKLCDSIEVIFPDYQTSGLFKIVRTEYDVLRERFSSMELGTLSTTLAEALGVNSSDSSSYHGSGGGGGGAVTGVKGDAEATYRTGNVNLTAANIGALPSNTAIHNVPSGGNSGQVLAKASGNDYDLTWVNQSGGGGGSVSDVQVNGTSVVSNGVANVPVARSDRYGVIKFDTNTDPGGGVIKITYQAGNGNEVTSYAPITQYVNGDYQPIRYKFLPDATQSTKGAMTASDKTKLDGIESGAEVNVVDDVQVDGTSVVSSGIATIPKAKYNQFGVVQVMKNNDAPAGVLAITCDGGDVAYAPLTIYDSGTQTWGTIRAKFLPDATTTTKGAMTATDKTKLDGIASGAEVNVQSNWNEADSSSDAYILNKPSLATVATSGNYSDLTGTPSIHNVPSGGTSGQVLSKASGTDYDLAWITPSGGGGGSVNDVQINSTSIVSSGVATIPKAGPSTFGVVEITSSPAPAKVTLTGAGSSMDVPMLVSDKVSSAVLPLADYNAYGAVELNANTEPGGGYVSITGAAQGGAVLKVPYVGIGSTDYTIRAKYLPDATTTTKGAMTAADKTKLDSITMTNGVIDVSCLPVYSGGVV